MGDIPLASLGYRLLLLLFMLFVVIYTNKLYWLTMKVYTNIIIYIKVYLIDNCRVLVDQ